MNSYNARHALLLSLPAAVLPRLLPGLALFRLRNESAIAGRGLAHLRRECCGARRRAAPAAPAGPTAVPRARRHPGRHALVDAAAGAVSLGRQRTLAGWRTDRQQWPAGPPGQRGTPGRHRFLHPFDATTIDRGQAPPAPAAVDAAGAGPTGVALLCAVPGRPARLPRGAGLVPAAAAAAGRGAGRRRPALPRLDGAVPAAAALGRVCRAVPGGGAAAGGGTLAQRCRLCLPHAFAAPVRRQRPDLAVFRLAAAVFLYGVPPAALAAGGGSTAGLHRAGRRAARAFRLSLLVDVSDGPGSEPGAQPGRPVAPPAGQPRRHLDRARFMRSVPADGQPVCRRRLRPCRVLLAAAPVCTIAGAAAARTRQGGTRPAAGKPALAQKHATAFPDEFPEPDQRTQCAIAAGGRNLHRSAGR